MKKTVIVILIGLLVLGTTLVFFKTNLFQFNTYKVGAKIDSLNGVYVYYNGKMGNVSGRNTSQGYNIGLKYQCVEFVKRFYLEELNHKMPNTYGHAKDFIKKGLKDGALNKDRNLVQYQNPSATKPKVNDIIVFDGHVFNKFGHIAIISKVTDSEIEIIQQNTGTTTRETIQLSREKQLWKLNDNSILGRLRSNLIRD